MVRKSVVKNQSHHEARTEIRSPDDMRVISELNNEIEAKDDALVAKDEIIAGLQAEIAESRTTNAEIVKLKTQMIAKEAQIQELKRHLEFANADTSTLQARLEEATSKHESVENELSQLAALKAAIKPFILSAKGEATTVPADWDALKELPA